MNIRLYNYNNYYNRMVKIMNETDVEYANYILQLENANFNPNDEISTEHIFGNSTMLYYGNADYAVCTDDSNKIISRWFVLENKRLRGGQWNITLRRDVIADFYNIIKTAPCFVEKGYVDNSSVLIYNNENMTFNQIKKDEYLLKNNINSPWLIAYLSRWHTEDDVQVYNKFEGSFKEDTELIPNYILDSLDDYDYYKYNSENNAYIFSDNITFGLYYQRKSDYEKNGNSAADRLWGVNKSGYYNSAQNYNSISSPLPKYNYDKNPTYSSETERFNKYSYLLAEYNKNFTIDADTNLPINSYSNLGTIDGYVLLTNESNKIIKVGNKYYRIISHIKTTQYTFDNIKRIPNAGSNTFGGIIFNTLYSAGGFVWSSGELNTPFIKIPFENQGVYFTFEEINRKEIAYSFTYDSNQTLQTPYEIIAAPLYSTTIVKGDKTIAHNGDIALSWFLDLGEKNASGLVYDIQIVPYCSIDTLDWTDYNIVKCYVDGSIEDELAWAVKVPLASFSKTYSLNIPLENDYKIAVNCDMYRFCSPNGIGNFDFNPAKNRGMVGYEVDCTLMPFNPYIKINPIFNTFNDNSLYGGDYNDYRGLICGGDFSLPVTTNQWETYQINNKTYQQVFDRQVSNLEINNNWARTEAIVGAGAGVVGGAAAGALAGSVIPVVGTVAGAIAGGGASVVGGIADIVKTFKLTEEQMSYMKDNYSYSLQTIQARPNTLTRTTAFNQNNKYFPYIEYYTCTDEEKEIFKNKLKYDGMTIMAIGNIEEYLGPDITFIKGKLIRIPDLGEDYHLASEISSEISKGVYI